MTKEQMPKKFVVSPLSAERSMHAKWANMSEDLIGKHWTNEVLFFLLFEHCARASRRVFHKEVSPGQILARKGSIIDLFSAILEPIFAYKYSFSGISIFDTA